MIILNRNKDVVHFQGTRWWAENGLLHWEKKDTGECGVVTVRDVLLRLKALNDMVCRSKIAPGITRYADEISEHQAYIESMVQLCQKAQQQGRPDVASHVAQMASDRRHQTRMVVMPGRNSQM